MRPSLVHRGFAWIQWRDSLNSHVGVGAVLLSLAMGSPSALAWGLIGSETMNFVDILRPSCALFLDFDGTLVDLAPQPEAVIVPSALVGTLASLNNYLEGALALI